MNSVSLQIETFLSNFNFTCPQGKSSSGILQYVPTILDGTRRVTRSASAECLCWSSPHPSLHCPPLPTTILRWTSNQVGFCSRESTKKWRQMFVKSVPWVAETGVSLWSILLCTVPFCLRFSDTILRLYLQKTPSREILKATTEGRRRSSEQALCVVIAPFKHNRSWAFIEPYEQHQTIDYKT